MAPIVETTSAEGVGGRARKYQACDPAQENVSGLRGEERENERGECLAWNAHGQEDQREHEEVEGRSDENHGDSPEASADQGGVSGMRERGRDGGGEQAFGAPEGFFEHGEEKQGRDEDRLGNERIADRVQEKLRRGEGKHVAIVDGGVDRDDEGVRNHEARENREDARQGKRRDAEQMEQTRRGGLLGRWCGHHGPSCRNWNANPRCRRGRCQTNGFAARRFRSCSTSVGC